MHILKEGAYLLGFSDMKTERIVNFICFFSHKAYDDNCFLLLSSQVYAPISEKESTFHRTLFVFMCTSMDCILQYRREQSECSLEKAFRRYILVDIILI